MSTKSKKGLIRLQPGEQQLLAPGVLALETAEGTQIQVNSSELPDPPRAMSANWCHAVAKDDSIELIFGQLPYGAKKLSAALVVSIGKKNLGQALYEANPTFVPELFRITEARGHVYTSRPEEEIMAALGTERVVFEKASIAAFAYADQDAELRFYRVSPHDVAQFKRGQRVKLVYAVVQIDLAMCLLYDLCKRVSELVPRSEGTQP